MTWIVGKNASIMTFPPDFFIDKDSIGINHAATSHGTRMAFSCYPIKIKQFLRDGYDLEHIIGVKPSVHIPDQFGKDHWPNLFPGILNDPVYYNNHTIIPLNEVAADIERLMTTRDSTFAYHNNGTALQLLMYWCVLHNRYPMRICGCNQTVECSNDCSEEACAKCSIRRGEPEAVAGWAASHAYTMEVIRCMNLHGDIVRYYEDYTDCMLKEKAYAELRESKA